MQDALPPVTPASQVCCATKTGCGNGWDGGRNYSAFASSVANALFGSDSRFRVAPPPLPDRRSLRPPRAPSDLATPGPPLLLTGPPFVGCAGLARRILSSSGARSNRRIIACISSCVGASTNANPLDSCVSWFRITLTESETRSSADSHCLMSSAVTQVGRLPKKTVKLINFVA